MNLRATITGLVFLLGLVSSPAWGFDLENLRLRGRLQTRFEIEEKPEGGWTSAFSLERARIDGRWKPLDWARLVLELEGAGMLDLDNQKASQVELKDAYGRLDLYDALQISAGQFKKPFSRLKMTSPWDLLVPERGLLDHYAVSQTDHGGFGGRDIGLMLSGRVKEVARLGYYLGAFSGPGFIDGIEESHKDFVGRLQVRLFKGLRLAVNASHKLYHDRRGTTRTANLFGGDLRYKISGFILQLEGAYGDNVNAGPGHRLWGAHGIVSYAIAFDEDWVLTPAVMVEMFDPDDQEDAQSTLRVAGALNLDIMKICRLVLFAEGATDELVMWDLENNRLEVKAVPKRILLQLNMSF